MSVMQDSVDAFFSRQDVIISEKKDGQLELKKIDKPSGRKVSSSLHEITKNVSNMNLSGSSKENNLCMKYQERGKLIQF